MIINIGDERQVDLEIIVYNLKNEIIEKKIYPDVKLAAGRTVTSLLEFRPSFPSDGYYIIEYIVKQKGIVK